MVTVGLVGYGYWGPNVARNLNNNPNYNFKIICDKRVKRIKKAKELYGESVEYSLEFDDLINDDNIEMIALAVETSAHDELAKKVLLAGKHVYVEKPFTDNVMQAEELKRIADQKGLLIHVDHIMVYHPIIKKIKQIIDSGELGDIIYYDCSRINLGQLKNDVSSMWDLSVHDLSIIDYLSNGPIPRDIKALGKNAYSEKPSVTFLSIEFENFIANVTASWVSPIKERRIIIAGTKKMLVYDDVDVLNKLIVYDKGFDKIEDMEYADYVIKSRSGEGVIPKLEQSDALYNSLEHFRNCICSGVQSATNADAAIRVIKILEQADQRMEK